jgi:hypothetical protein
MNKRATENYILKFLTVSSVSSDSIVKESLMTLSTRYALSFEKYKGK